MKGIKEVIESFGFGTACLNLNWYDVTGVFHVSKRCLATVTLVERGYSNHFVSFKVEIIDKVNGLIASKFFDFADYMHEYDIPEGHKARGYVHEAGLFVWHNKGDLAWYIAVPTKKALAEYSRAVTNFILEFDMGPGTR